MSFPQWIVRWHGIYDFKSRTLWFLAFEPPRIDSILPTCPRRNDMHGWQNDMGGWLNDMGDLLLVMVKAGT